MKLLVTGLVVVLFRSRSIAGHGSGRYLEQLLRGGTHTLQIDSLHLISVDMVLLQVEGLHLIVRMDLLNGLGRHICAVWWIGSIVGAWLVYKGWIAVFFAYLNG